MRPNRDRVRLMSLIRFTHVKIAGHYVKSNEHTIGGTEINNGTANS